MKQKLFIDFDSTITNTHKSFCEYYNKFYNHLDGYKYADHNKCNQWGYGDECPLAVNDLDFIFGQWFLFAKLDLFPNAYEILEKLSERYEIIIVSIGTYRNIALKSEWVEECLPFIHESIFLCKGNGVIMDKSTVNMESGIFIDDVQSNLDSTNADRKILFGRRFVWNEEWNGEHYMCWNEIEKAL